jgi:Tol biopolymer transport system component
VDATGVEGNGQSANPFLSPDGTLVVFDSFATNLVQGTTTNGSRQVFVANRSASTTGAVFMKRMSADSTGVNDGNQDSQFGTISNDGRFVGFSSFATNLVSNDTNGKGDVFVAQR